MKILNHSDRTVVVYVLHTHLQAIFLLVSHRAAVLTRPLPELSDCLPFLHSLLVPLIDGVELSLLLLLGPLVLQTGLAQGDVPWSLTDILGDVRVDVSGKYNNC